MEGFLYDVMYLLDLIFVDIKKATNAPQVLRNGVRGGEDGPADGGGHPGRDQGEEEEAEAAWGGGRPRLVVKGEVTR